MRRGDGDEPPIAGSGDPAGEITLTTQSDPALTWTHRLCPGQQTEALAEALRRL